MAMAQNQLDMSQDDVSVTADEQKMQVCSHIFYEATDVNNPSQGHRLKDELVGRISNET